LLINVFYLSFSFTFMEKECYGGGGGTRVCLLLFSLVCEVLYMRVLASFHMVWNLSLTEDVKCKFTKHKNKKKNNQAINGPM